MFHKKNLSADLFRGKGAGGGPNLTELLDELSEKIR